MNYLGYVSPIWWAYPTVNPLPYAPYGCPFENKGTVACYNFLSEMAFLKVGSHFYYDFTFRCNFIEKVGIAKKFFQKILQYKKLFNPKYKKTTFIQNSSQFNNHFFFWKIFLMKVGIVKNFFPEILQYKKRLNSNSFYYLFFEFILRFNI